jgi:hypothetical protein
MKTKTLKIIHFLKRKVLVLFSLGDDKRPEGVRERSITHEYNNILYIIIIYNIL